MQAAISNYDEINQIKIDRYAKRRRVNIPQVQKQFSLPYCSCSYESSGCFSHTATLWPAPRLAVFTTLNHSSQRDQDSLHQSPQQQETTHINESKT